MHVKFVNGRESVSAQCLEKTLVRAGETVSRQCLEPFADGREMVSAQWSYKADGLFQHRT